jgi:hypothetical protein
MLGGTLMFMCPILMRFPRSFPGIATTFTAPLKDTHDGLRGFEIKDPDGYVLFFGRPR